MSGEFKNEFNRSQECDEASLKIYWVLDCADKSLASHNDADNDPAFFILTRPWNVLFNFG